MNNIEEYRNLLELFKQALLFYSNSDNYVNKHKTNGELASLINIDSGFQAKFALEQAKIIDDLNKEAENDYFENISNFIETNEDHEDIMKSINELNNDNFFNLQ